MFIRLAITPEDYEMCRKAFDDGRDYEFPTVMAGEGDTLQGFVSTDTRQGLIICGPMWIDQSLPATRRVRLCLKMIQHYELALQGTGVTQYLFHTTKGHMTPDAISRVIDLEPYDMDNTGDLWYIRKMAPMLHTLH